MDALNSTCSLSLNAMGLSLPEWVVSRLGVPPSRPTMYTSRLPSLSDAKAMCLLSGLQMGVVS